MNEVNDKKNNELKSLLEKYDIPAPRYTSYPTVPYWSNDPKKDEWISSVEKTLKKEGSSWSMYLHIPFCETLCTFCGCKTTITKDHKREPQYLNHIKRVAALFKIMSRYCS